MNYDEKIFFGLLIDTIDTNDIKLSDNIVDLTNKILQLYFKDKISADKPTCNIVDCAMKTVISAKTKLFKLRKIYKKSIMFSHFEKIRNNNNDFIIMI